MFPEIPAFATKIKLDRVFAKSGTWLSSDYEKLMEIVSENAKVIIKGPLDVDVPMAEVFTDKGVNVNQTLVQCCPNLTRCETVDSDDSEEDGVVIEEEAIVGIEELEGNEVKVREIEEMVEKTTPFDTTGFKFKVKSLPEMALTENTLMSIMAVLSYNKVVLKAASETLADELILLGCEIQETIDNQPVLAKFDVGTPCVCPYTEDGNWYRAEIYNTDKIDCSFVYVFFVDYGNVELVSTKDVKMMRPKWFELPVLCHVAELNIKLKDDGHAQLVLEHMKKLYGKHKLGRIVVGDPLTVNLYESDGSLCYQMLLDSGLLIKE
ncbi:hypothetical protein JTB14_016252 [Gonioctena quinquepunctata]|nr:hypothetical protein JTB14_016252 [Gonioctena quinquepunctata]